MTAAGPKPAAMADVPIGSCVELVRTLDQTVAALRLAELGLRLGSRLVVLGRTVGGGRIVGVGHARIAIDRELAAQLSVIPADQ